MTRSTGSDGGKPRSDRRKSGGTRYAQFCALARAAELLGERWTLLLVRELLLGPRRFGDLAERLDGVSPTLLVARLAGMIEAGVVRRTRLPPPFSTPVYELTEIGRALHPAIRELIRWGGQFLFPARPDDAFEPEWVLLALDAVARGDPTPKCRIGLRIVHQGKSASFVVTGGASGTIVAAGEAPGAPLLQARFDTLLRILSRELSLRSAIAKDGATLTGSVAIASKLPLLFELGTRRPSDGPRGQKAGDSPP